MRASHQKPAAAEVEVSEKKAEGRNLEHNVASEEKQMTGKLADPWDRTQSLMAWMMCEL